MSSIETKLMVMPSRALPQSVPDSARSVQARGGRGGELIVNNRVPTKHLLADEGGYYVATNPTPGTVIAYGSAGVQTTFADTAGFMVWKNNASASDPAAKRMYLDYLRVLQIGGTAPATTTSVQFAMKIDSGNRVPTANSSLLSPQNANMDAASNPVGQLWVPNAGTITVPAAVNARLVSRGQAKGGPTLVLDEHNFAFGLADASAQGGYLTTVASYVSRMPPVVLGPQEFAVFHLWFPGGATNPFSFEFETAWWEA